MYIRIKTRQKEKTTIKQGKQNKKKIIKTPLLNYYGKKKIIVVGLKVQEFEKRKKKNLKFAYKT